MNRRDFIKSSAITTTIVASGISLNTFANSQPVTSKQRWGMLVDINKLDSARVDTMIAACKTEHGWGNEEKSNTLQQASWIKSVTVRDTTTGKEDTLPLMCQHCAEPPCVDVCPTNASMKREDGIVLVDKHRCIGCRYCMMACPYDARSFVHETITNQTENTPRGKGTVESCTMCVHKVDNGEAPACVAASGGAVIFGDLNDTNSEISKSLRSIQSTQIRADLNLNTGVRYSGI